MLNPAESLILEHLHPKNDARILVMEGGAGWMAAEAARKVPNGEALNLDRDFRNVQAANLLLAEIPNARAADDVLPATDDWDFVLLNIPKERRFARALLVAAWEALEPGGQLLLAGPTRGGAKAVISDAERLFGNAALLGYRGHQRVAACLRGNALPGPLPQEFQQSGIAPGTRRLLQIARPEGPLTLETHPGIFSWESLDEGTALLLDHLQAQPGERVWDVGCGYGVIGLCAALGGAGFVAMSDVNLLAVRYALKNAERKGIETPLGIFPADGLNITHDSRLSTPDSPLLAPRFDLIVSNPAFHQGREVDKSMADQLIASASARLAPGGRLALVANRFLNYDRSMREYFPRVSRIAETGKFHVIEAQI